MRLVLRLALMLSILSLQGLHDPHSHHVHSEHLQAVAASEHTVPTHTDPVAPDRLRALPAALHTTGHPHTEPASLSNIDAGTTGRNQPRLPAHTHDTAATDLTALGIART
ncbi:hypothetical protein GCM10020369_44300 [Cryptosporangium minutisporangium]|uniref:Secreted protein n=1 Tax=Cryptosporangium minutisporangium TaxID=113569 RepID=A0ABP6T133_9ACTN